MRKRFKRLKKILKALDINVDEDRSNRSKEVQAGVFLAQLRRQLEVGEFDLTSQTGYFFKWYSGPYSSRLSEAYRDLLNYIRFENATNGGHVGTPSLVRHARKVTESIEVPDNMERPDWMRTLAVIAYLRKAASWDKEAAIQEANSALDTDVASYFDEAERQIEKILEFERDAPASTSTHGEETPEVTPA
jgi:hypothetical protein